MRETVGQERSGFCEEEAALGLHWRREGQGREEVLVSCEERELINVLMTVHDENGVGDQGCVQTCFLIA
jgi:hypothetical protein